MNSIKKFILINEFKFLISFAPVRPSLTANSLGTGEASERVIARTSGLPPYPPGPLGQFILRNSTSLILRLHKWKSSG